jgi:hypothetical protein
VNNEFKNMLKAMYVTYFNVIMHNSLVGIEETHKIKDHLYLTGAFCRKNYK